MEKKKQVQVQDNSRKDPTELETTGSATRLVQITSYSVSILLLLGSIAVTVPKVSETLGLRDIDDGDYTKVILAATFTALIGIGVFTWAYLELGSRNKKEVEQVPRKAGPPLREPQEIIDEIHKLEGARQRIDDKLEALYWVFEVEKEKGNVKDEGTSGRAEVSSKKTPPGM